MALPPPDPGYLAYHAPRYDFLLGLARRSIVHGARRVLDIGPSPFTSMLRESMPCPVDTLGLQPSGREGGAMHYHADLNAPEALPDMPAYDLIVFAEVLEHLHVAPVRVLTALARWLAADGTLLLQTPNAASLPKRIKLLLGRNPYELIRADPRDPGHVREYTLRELICLSHESGLVIEQSFRRFYFDARFARHGDGAVRPQPILGRLKNLGYRALPPFLREGITLVLRAAAPARTTP
jgi:SAM-dependent methyltransferase